MNWQEFYPAITSNKCEDIEWSIRFSYRTPEKDKPRVLLIGDSICNGYQNSVRALLEGRVNVTFWASSGCVTEKWYYRELEFVLEQENYGMICLNNGLHSGLSDIDDWSLAYEGVVKFIRAKLPDTLLSLTLTTPPREPGIREKVLEINRRTLAVAKKYELPVIDLFGAMDGLDRTEYWADNLHFTQPGIDIQAGIISEHVLERLKG